MAAKSEQKSQVESKLREFERLFKNKDFLGLENRYAENCVFLPAGRTRHLGRAGVAGAFKALVEAQKWDSISVKSENSELSGDLLISTGSFVTKRADGSQAAEGKFLFGWRKIGGQLLLAYDIFNLNSA